MIFALVWLGLACLVLFGLAWLDVIWYPNYNLVACGAHGLHVQLLLPRLQSTQRVPPTRSQITSQPTEYTEWQRPFSGVHSVMMEKLAHAGEGGGARPPPFTIPSITYKSGVRGGRYTPPLFLLYPYMCSVSPPVGLVVQRSGLAAGAT
jgi:hypothetical protein